LVLTYGTNEKVLGPGSISRTPQPEESAKQVAAGGSSLPQPLGEKGSFVFEAVARAGTFDGYRVYVAPLVGLTPGEGACEPIEELAFSNSYLRSMNSMR
jgi:hypothetical protein